MTAQNPIEPIHPEGYDPFPEPQTLPSGWDLANIVPDSQPAAPAEAESNPDEEVH
jgi:hypothetical protein